MVVLMLVLAGPAAAEPFRGDAGPDRRLRARTDGDEVILTWELNPEEPPTGYRVEVRREGEPLLEEVVPERSFVHEGLAPTRIHRYVVAALFEGGEGEPIEVGPMAFFPPPQNLRADVDGDSVTLTWDSPSGVPEGTRVGYDVVRRGPGPLEEQESEPLAAFVRDEGAGEFVGGVTDTELVDTGLEPDKYVYSVRAVYLDEKYEEFWDRRDEDELLPPRSGEPAVATASIGEPAAPADGEGSGDGDPVALEAPSIHAGGEFVVRGDRCPAGEEVIASVDGTEVAVGAVDEAGRFALEAPAPAQPGVVDVEIACGDVQATVPLPVVLTISTGGAASVVGTVLAFFVLVVALLRPRRPLREASGRGARPAARR